MVSVLAVCISVVRRPSGVLDGAALPSSHIHADAVLNCPVRVQPLNPVAFYPPQYLSNSKLRNEADHGNLKSQVRNVFLYSEPLVMPLSLGPFRRRKTPLGNLPVLTDDVDARMT
jgi:hypothetical protein